MLRALTREQAQSISDLAVKRTLKRRMDRAAGAREPSFRDILNDSDRSALRDAIAALSRPARDELCALMYIGRGDFDGDFAYGVNFAAKMSDEEVTDKITEKEPALPKYIEAGLIRLGAGHSNPPRQS